jgi:hypothetical protein
MKLPPDCFWSGSGRFPHPDWERIAALVETTSHDSAALNQAWSSAATQWMACFADALGPRYKVAESENFILVSTADTSRVRSTLRFLEDCDARIAGSLPFIDRNLFFGKCAVIVFEEEADFYGYFADFHEEDGDYAMAGGVYLNRGYGHFALPSEDLGTYQSVMCHELCHAFLSCLDLPLWLNEAVTGEIEHQIVGGNPYLMDRDIVREHRDYWTAPRIRSFWTGESFGFPDEGQHLSYHLARFLFNALASYSTPETMNRFMVSATRADAGVSAAREILGVDLVEVLSDLLGMEDQDLIEPG